MTMSSGNSNAMPKASIIVMTKLMYRSTWIRFDTLVGRQAEQEVHGAAE